METSSKSPSKPMEHNAEHHEDLSPQSGRPDADIDFLAENVAYGPHGIRGLLSSGPYNLSAAFLASLGGFSFGYDQGVMGIVNVLPQFHAVIPRAATAFGKGLMTGMLLLGAFVACWFYPYNLSLVDEESFAHHLRHLHDRGCHTDRIVWSSHTRRRPCDRRYRNWNSCSWSSNGIS